jgi:hypothetical protein
MKEEKHRKECKPFDTARKYWLIHCVDIPFQPLEYHMSYTDPKDKKGKFCNITLDKKKVLIVKACPFCGKILEDL